MRVFLLIIFLVCTTCSPGNEPPPTTTTYVLVSWRTYQNHEPTYNGWEQYTNTEEEFIPMQTELFEKPKRPCNCWLSSIGEFDCYCEEE